MRSHPARNFRALAAVDVHIDERSSSFVPFGRAAPLKIGHLPDEIEDLHRWFAGYYRRSVQMKGKRDRDARAGVKTADGTGRIETLGEDEKMKKR
jgi:hypothetical protein